MGYKLVEVKDDAEFGPLVAAWRDGFTDPGTAIWALISGDWRKDDPDARQQALEGMRARAIAAHRADSTSTWLKVVDEETGEIGAGGRWNVIEKERPYDDRPPRIATWMPEGELKTICNELLEQAMATSKRLANRPHIFLNILFTAPNHRRKGCGRLIMDWGFEQAAQKGLDVYLEATAEGKPLYEKYGMKVIEENELKLDEASLAPSENPELRQALIRAVSPCKLWSMLKPASELRAPDGSWTWTSESLNNKS